MSEEVNKEPTKGAEQEISELSDEQLDEAAGGATETLRSDRKPRDESTDGAGTITGEASLLLPN